MQKHSLICGWANIENPSLMNTSSEAKLHSHQICISHLHHNSFEFSTLTVGYLTAYISVSSHVHVYAKKSTCNGLCFIGFITLISLMMQRYRTNVCHCISAFLYYVFLSFCVSNDFTMLDKLINLVERYKCT